MILKKTHIFLIILFLIKVNMIGQSITGMSGFYTIPTAEILNDGEVLIGYNYFPKNQLKAYNYNYDAAIVYVSFAFLPSVEISLRTTYPVNFDRAAIGDRMPSVRIRILKETAAMPAVAFGLHDFATAFGGSEAVYFNSTYFVASKKIKFNEIFNEIDFNLGYGFKTMKAAGYQFNGFFYGASFYFLNSISILGEFDAERFNAGLRITLFKHFKLLGGFMDMKHFSGGAAVSFVL